MNKFLSRYMLLLASVFLCAFESAAQMDLIRQHQAWADERFRSPETMNDEELISNAIMIIESNLQEDSAIMLLYELGKKIPEVNDYLDHHVTGNPDYHLQKGFAALYAMADYAEKNYPGSTFARRCRLQALTISPLAKNHTSELNAFVSELEKTVGPRSDRKLQSFLLQAKAAALANEIYFSRIDDPALYPEIFRLEKEALKLYPIDSREDDIDRVRLYNWIATLKTLLTNDQMAMSAHYDAGEREDMNYILTGSWKCFPNNALQYYQTILDILKNIYTPGHPYFQDCKGTELAFKLSVISPTEEVIEQQRDLFNYVMFYYPASSYEEAYRKINNYFFCMDVGIPNNETGELENALKVIKSSLGEEHPNFLSLLNAMAYYKILNEGISLHDAINYITSHFDKFPPEGEDMIILKVGLAQNTEQQITAKDVAETMEEAALFYLSFHQPSVKSIQLGTTLSSYYSFLQANHNKAIKLLDLLLADVKKLSKSDTRYDEYEWFIKLMQAEITTLSHPQDADKIYGTFLKETERSNPAVKPLKISLIKTKWALRKSENYEYQKSYDLLGGLLEGLEFSPDYYISAVGQMATDCMNGNLDDNILTPHVEKAIRIVDNLMESGNSKRLDFRVLSELIAYLRNEGRFEEAIRLNEHQLAIFKEFYPIENSYEYARILQSMAALYTDLDRFNDADRLMEEAARISNGALTNFPSTQFLSILWSNYYYSRRGDPFNSWKWMQDLSVIGHGTMILYEASGRSDEILYSYVTRFIAESLSLMSVYYKWVDEIPAHKNEITAEQLEMAYAVKANVDIQADQALEFGLELKKNFKNHDSNYRSNEFYQALITGLALLYRDREKDQEKFLELYKELAEYSNYPYTQLNACTDLANEYLSQQKYDEAIIYINMAENNLAAIKNAGTNNYMSLNNLKFRHAVETENYDAALPLARQIFTQHKSILDGNFQLMTQGEQINFMDTYGDPAWAAGLILQYKPEELKREMYDMLLYRTGMQLKSQKAVREAIAKSDNPRVIELLDSIAINNRLLSTIDVTPLMEDQMTYSRNMIQYTNIKSKINLLEREILDLTSEMRTDDISGVKWEEVRNSLADNEAALEFVFSHNRLMALLLRKDAEAPVPVMLCEADEVIKKIQPSSIRNSASLAKHLYRPEDTDLYRMLWQPIESQLQGVDRVYFSTPGFLSQLSFNAFYTPDGTPLFDKYDLVQLSTTAQLVVDHPDKKPETIAMMGDILYSPDQKPSVIPERGNRDIDPDFDFDVSGDDSRKLNSRVFKHLPFSAVEIDDITGLFPKKSVDVERGHNATESRLHAMMERRPDILHLATHGYYINISDKNLNQQPFFMKKGTGAMQRSGFALAGAEETWRGTADVADEEDGIVTAAEVADFDLRGTSLVALSACETALGDTSFEGIFGLQRGFKQAGVQSLLVSLWSVNDDSTSLFMTEFYRNLLNGETKQKSWRNAVERVRKDYPTAYFWAPFILLDGI